MKTFQELGVSEAILRAIQELGYENPMPVQEEVIPYLLENGNDIVALAQTGTGKTAAFGLPLIQKTNVKNVVPQALILCPTRELCLQISGDLSDYSKYVNGLRVLPVYGGSSIESQIRNLKKGVHIIVATPGRLIDLMERGTVNLSTVHNVVMDEADEMLNMGFTDSINAILAGIPQERNTLLFSATMSAEIARIARNYLHDAKEIVIGTKNESNRNVNHIYYMVHAKDKYLALKRIVDYYPQIYGIIFCRTRKETQEIADKLIEDGYNADSLHGELSQQQRDLVMQKFRQRHLQLLVATDVAARGLDVDDLTHVLHYGLPDDIESYNHRSGRTGRAGKTGTSIAIINLREKGRMREIEKVINKQFTAGEMPSGQQICEKQLLKMIDDIEKVKVNEEEIATFLPDIYRKLDWLEKEDIIKRMVSLEFNRFLEYYRNAPEIQTVTDKRNKHERGSKSGNRRGNRQAEPGYTRLFLNLGKTDNFYAAQIIDLINRHVNGPKVNIGRIDLMKNFAFFEVDEDDAPAVIKGLSKAVVNGRKVMVEEADAGDSNSGSALKRGNKRTSHSENKVKRGRNESQTSDKRAAKRHSGKGEHKDYESENIRTTKKKDDWKQFFNHSKTFRGDIPDFSEEGWAWRKPKKK